MPVTKNVKSSSGHPASVPGELNAKGKGKAIAPMELDDAPLQDGAEHSDGSSRSEFDDDEASGDDSGDSLDTDAEIELTQQSHKSKQTLSAHLSAHFFLAESDIQVPP